MTDKKRIVSTAVTAGVFIALLIAYLTVFLPMSREMSDTDAGETTELEEWEDSGYGNTILMSKRAERGDIASLEVENEYGSYCFVKKKDSSGEKFVLDGHENITYSDMSFSMLIVTTGIPTASERITTEASVEDLELYGLDEPQAKWRVTTLEGEIYEIALGAKMLSGGGYYAMRTDHPTHVYAMSTTVEQSVLLPVESMLNPLLCTGIDTNNYLTCDNFKLTLDGKTVVRIRQRKESEFYNPDAQVETQMTYPGAYKVDDTFFLGKISLLDKYNVESDESADSDIEALTAVYLGDDPEQLRSYGLGSNYYNLSFTISAEVGSNVTYSYDMRISQRQADGYYYAVSNYYDYQLVVRCPSAMFSWIDADIDDDGEPKIDLVEWIDDDPIMLNIAYINSIELNIGGRDIEFSLKHGTDSDGNATLDVEGTDGFSMSNSDIYIFRNYYKVMLGVKIMADSKLDDDAVEKLISDSDKLIVSMRFNMKDGTVNEYSFYRDTTRRALMTSEGTAQFYVLVDWLEKLESDTNRLFLGLEIDSSMKY